MGRTTAWETYMRQAAAQLGRACAETAAHMAENETASVREIRELAEKMFELVYPVAPHIFAKSGPACVSGPCPEGKMCCGKTAEVRAKYASIKEAAGV